MSSADTIEPDSNHDEVRMIADTQTDSAPDDQVRMTVEEQHHDTDRDHVRVTAEPAPESPPREHDELTYENMEEMARHALKEQERNMMLALDSTLKSLDAMGIPVAQYLREAAHTAEPRDDSAEAPEPLEFGLERRHEQLLDVLGNVVDKLSSALNTDAVSQARARD